MLSEYPYVEHPADPSYQHSQSSIAYKDCQVTKCKSVALEAILSNLYTLTKAYKAQSDN